MKHLRRTFPFQLRKEGTKPDGSYFEGHCAVFNSIDHYGTIMGRGCFAKRLGNFLANGFMGGLNHDWDNPIGSPRLAREDDKGLFVGGDVIDSTHGLDVRKYLAQGVCKKLSFGFDVMGKSYLENENDVKAYWESVNYTPSPDDVAASKYGAMLFTELEIYEFSPVMVPGNDLADITTVRDGAAARPSLDDLLRSGQATVEDLCSACARYQEMRSKDGRGLQPERRAHLLRMRDRIDAALAGTVPRADATDLLQLRRFALETEAYLLASGA